MELRKYQQEAAAKAIQSVYNQENVALQLATGTGKSLIIAEVVRHFCPTEKACLGAFTYSANHPTKRQHL
jgi:superfamily II DNA or RNA helicase